MTERPRIRGSARLREVERPHISEKLDYAELVRRQIERCLMSVGDEFAFASNVLALEALIPTSNLSDDYLKEVEESVETFEYSTPVMVCGVPINSEIISEMTEEVEETDWHRRLNAAINLFESLGITWRRIPTSVL